MRMFIFLAFVLLAAFISATSEAQNYSSVSPTNIASGTTLNTSAPSNASQSNYIFYQNQTSLLNNPSNNTSQMESKYINNTYNALQSGANEVTGRENQTHEQQEAASRGIPGFEAMLAIAGTLASAYMLGRRG